MKIVVVGLGYVGVSNAVLLAQHNEVIGVDISNERVDKLNALESPIIDNDISEYLAKKDLNLYASTDLEASVVGADYVIVSTPTDYDEKTNFFDTSSVEEVITQVIATEPNACIVVKSTVPVGFIEDIGKRLKTNSVIFSPEFLREGKALYDNLHPSRIIVGEKSNRAEVFAGLLKQGAASCDVTIYYTGSREAEAIKLFSNSYLAMRVGFFNELDSYAMYYSMSSEEIIKGVSSDPRIGEHYNNPSFGYGGYCLPKDSKQLFEQFNNVPQNLIEAIILSNETRKNFIVNHVIRASVKVVGIYRLIMKSDSDNFRQAAVMDLIDLLVKKQITVIIYEPLISKYLNSDIEIENCLETFADKCEMILANRSDQYINAYSSKLFTRDIYNSD